MRITTDTLATSIRMKAVGQGPVCGPDDFGRSVLGDLQSFVVVHRVHGSGLVRWMPNVNG